MWTLLIGQFMSNSVVHTSSCPSMLESLRWYLALLENSGTLLRVRTFSNVQQESGGGIGRLSLYPRNVVQRRKQAVIITCNYHLLSQLVSTMCHNGKTIVTLRNEWYGNALCRGLPIVSRLGLDHSVIVFIFALTFWYTQERQTCGETTKQGPEGTWSVRWRCGSDNRDLKVTNMYWGYIQVAPVVRVAFVVELARHGCVPPRQALYYTLLSCWLLDKGGDALSKNRHNCHTKSYFSSSILRPLGIASLRASPPLAVKVTPT